MAYNYEYPYTNPAQANLDWLISITKGNAEQLGLVAEKLTTLTDKVSDLSTLSDKVSELVTTVSSLSTRVDALEAGGGSGGGSGGVSGDYVTQTEFDSFKEYVDNRFTSLATAIVDLDARVTALDGGGGRPIIPPPA